MSGRNLACVAAVYFPFPGRVRKNERKCGRAKKHAWGVQQNWAELVKGWARWREKEGRKGIASSEAQTFYWAPFAHEQEATVQFDWLLARQLKYDIRNLSFMHNPTCGTQQDQNRHGRVRRSVRRGLRILCSGNVERPFAKWQTHRSKTEARSCHESLVRKHDVLAIDSSNTRRRLHGYHCYFHVASQICFKVSEYTEYWLSTMGKGLTYFGNMNRAIYCAASWLAQSNCQTH